MVDNGQIPAYKMADLKLVKLNGTPVTRLDAGLRALVVVTSFGAAALLSDLLFGIGPVLVLVLAVALTVDAFFHSGRFIYDRVYGFDVVAHRWDDKVPTILKWLGWPSGK